MKKRTHVILSVIFGLLVGIGFNDAQADDPGPLGQAIRQVFGAGIEELTDIGALTPTDGNVIVGDGSTWVAESGATARASLGAGDVTGPVSATDNAIARYDATTGKLLQGSLATVSDAGQIYAPSFVSQTDAQAAVALYSDSVLLSSVSKVTWASGTGAFNTPDTGLARSAAGVVKVTDGSTGAGSLDIGERTAPTGAANTARLYAVDNGAGKTQLYVIFGSGAAQLLATEP